MERSIKIFKSFEEQEEYYLEKMLKITALERFKNLFEMQRLTLLFHPPVNEVRRIIIHTNGHS